MLNFVFRDHYTYWVYGVLTVMLLVSCVPVFSREDTVCRIFICYILYFIEQFFFVLNRKFPTSSG